MYWVLVWVCRRPRHAVRFYQRKPTGEVVIGVQHFFTPEYIWFDIYYAAATALFALHGIVCNRMLGLYGRSSAVRFDFSGLHLVQVSVVINAWYGPFYNDIQKALTGDKASRRAIFTGIC